MPTQRISRRQAFFGIVGVAALSWGASAYRWRKAQKDPALFTFADHPGPRLLTPIRFSDELGTPFNLAAMRGRFVLLNIWATWCPPCRDEMPALDRLQASLADANFEVVAVSIDAEGLPPVRAFFKQVGIRHMHPYLDSFHDAEALGAAGIPVTLLIDKEGREIARKRGPAKWDDPGVMRAIRSHLPVGSK